MSANGTKYQFPIGKTLASAYFSFMRNILLIQQSLPTICAHQLSECIKHTDAQKRQSSLKEAWLTDHLSRYNLEPTESTVVHGNMIEIVGRVCDQPTTLCYDAKIIEFPKPDHSHT